jgi:hypothetical protein
MAILRLMPDTMDPLDVLAWNRAHPHKKREMHIRTCTQFLAALDSKEDHLLNDYTTHDFGHCKTCSEHKLVSWAQGLEAKREAEAADRWVEQNNRRLEKLGRFEFRELSKEETEAFLAMRGDEGWVLGRLKEATTPRTWNGIVTHPAELNSKHVSAAILFCLTQNQPISWDGFVALVKQIEDLDKPAELEATGY